VPTAGKCQPAVLRRTTHTEALVVKPPRVGNRRCNRPVPGAQPIGMTLVELVLLVGTLGMLFAAGIPLYANQVDKARNAKAAADIVMIQFDIRLFASVNNNQLPISLDQLGRAVNRDPWGHAYEYLNFDTVTGKGKMRKDRFLVPINSDYDLYSMGKDGKTATPLTSKNSRDDIIRANNGGFIGLAADY
jgi:general secretion pathway protein G